MSGKLNTCKAEYAKDSNINPDDIRSLLEWAKKESHMPNISEYQVIQFYHACMFSIQRTKRILEIHYNYKNEAPEFYSGQDFMPPKYHHSFWDLAYCFDLPKSTPKGYRVIYSGLRDFDPAKYNFKICSRMHVKTILSLILEQGVCPGYSMIYDFKGFGLAQLASINLMQLKKISYISQETTQFRMKEVHLVNGPGIVEKFLMLIKPFLKKELIDMIHVHSDMNTLFDHLGKDNLPIDIGGTLPQTRDDLNNNIENRVNSLSNFVHEELDKRAKPQSCHKQNDLSLSLGSFKRITID